MPSTIVELFTEAVDGAPSRPAFRFRSGDDWQQLTFGEAATRVEAIGAGLLDLGIAPGDRVAIVSDTRLEWSLCDYALLGAGMVVVPIYPTSSAAELEHILRDSDAAAVIVDTPQQLERVRALHDSLPALQHLVLIDADAGAADSHVGTGAGAGDALALATVEQKGMEQGPQRWHDARGAVRRDDLATLIYTSGTTGPPKGCMLSHANYVEMTQIISSDEVNVFQGDDVLALFLPLAHTFGRLMHFVASHCRMELAFTTVPTLMRDLPEIRPTLLPAVPRVYEKIYNTMMGRFAGATGPQEKLISWAMRVGALRGQYVQYGRRVPPLLEAQFRLAYRQVFSQVRECLGGNVRLCISGGAPLSRDVHSFFLASGVIIIEGYGLTECTTGVAINRPRSFRVGSVGKPMPRTEIRTADDGEILVRGPQVFQGYHGDQEATAAVMRDSGWLATGDVGVLDHDGFLYITDRKKDIIVTANGKNVAPQNIEGAFKATQYISQAVVVGDARPFLAALVTLDAAELATFAAEHELPTDMRELVTTDEVLELVRDAVEKVNADRGRSEQVRRVRVLSTDFSTEAAELTATMKVRRAVITDRYRTQIDDMYADEAPELAAIDTQTGELLEREPAAV